MILVLLTRLRKGVPCTSLVLKVSRDREGKKMAVNNDHIVFTPYTVHYHIYLCPEIIQTIILERIRSICLIRWIKRFDESLTGKQLERRVPTLVT